MKQVKPIGPDQNDKEFPTVGEVLADGTMVELVRDPKEPNRLRLLIWKGKESEIVAQFEYRGRIYVPVGLQPAHVQVIQFPTHAADFGAAGDLFGKIRGFMQQYANLSTDVATLVTYFVFASWFSDCFSETPMLFITGPSAESLHLLRLLSCCCRRSLRAKLLRLSDFFSLPLEFHPTLLLNERNQSARTLQFLTSSGSADFCIPGNGELRLDCCAKAIYAGPGIGTVLSECDMRVALSPYQGRVPSLSKSLPDEFAEEFQPMLLAYRLANYHRVLNSEFDVPSSRRACANARAAWGPASTMPSFRPVWSLCCRSKMKRCGRRTPRVSRQS